MPLKLIIFDLDGTLVDTARDITEALNHAIGPRGLRPVSVVETTALIGEGTTRLIEKAMAPLGKTLDEDTKSATLQRFLDYYSKNLSVHSRLYPDVREVLWKLQAFDKAVLSNKREALSRRLLEDLGVAGAFTLIAGSDTAASKKPSPEPVRYVLEKTGAPAEDALMVGDSPYDIEAAKGAGVKTVAVTYGYRDRGLLEDADYMINNLAELLPLLFRMSAMEEKRHQARYAVVPVCRKHINISVRNGEGFDPASMLDLSESGLMLSSPMRFEPGAPFECEISIPGALTRTVGIKGVVKHSQPYEREYFTGVEIEDISGRIWLRVFKKVCDFISEREGSMF